MAKELLDPVPVRLFHNGGVSQHKTIEGGTTLVGFVDDVLVEKRALSAEEIQAMVKPVEAK